MSNRRTTKSGQALVEFALASTLIFFLLAAAVDLGLIFFAIQGLHNAAQEGAAYGSRWLIGSNPRTLDANTIRDRVRHESGSKGGIGFVNLLDLNNDGIPDVNPDQSVANCTPTICQKGSDGTYIVNKYIQLQLLADTDTDGTPMNDLVHGQPTVCSNPQSSSVPCYVRVTVNMDYKTIFPLTPAFARITTLHSSYIVRLRDAYSAGGTAATPPIFQSVTPLPTDTPLPTNTRTPVPPSPTSTRTPTRTPSPTACSVPRTPSISATKSGSNARVSWSSVSGATSYAVYRATGNSTPPSSSYTQVTTVSGTSATIALSGGSGTKNWFYVVAINACGRSSASNTVTVTR